MAIIISLSLSPRNMEYLKKNNVGKSKLFADAIDLHRRIAELKAVDEEIDIITEFYDLYLNKVMKISYFQKEIIRRNETITALQDVLARKEIEKR